MPHRLAAARGLTVALLATIAVACGPGISTPASSGRAAAPGTNGPTVTAAATTTGPGANLPAACDLLTRADFVEILGLEVATAAESNLISAYTTDCEWTFTGGGPTIVLGVLATGGADFLDRTVEYEGGAPVEGLGDRAVRTDTSNTLLVLSGDALLDLQSIGAGDDIDRALVERILRNLGS